MTKLLSLHEDFPKALAEWIYHELPEALELFQKLAAALKKED